MSHPGFKESQLSPEENEILSRGCVIQCSNADELRQNIVSNIPLGFRLYDKRLDSNFVLFYKPNNINFNENENENKGESSPKSDATTYSLGGFVRIFVNSFEKIYERYVYSLLVSRRY